MATTLFYQKQKRASGRRPSSHHHGIPAVPMIRRTPSDNAELCRPIIYVDCELDDSLELPFGGSTWVKEYNAMERERQQQRRLASMFKTIVVMTLLFFSALAGWYLARVCQEHKAPSRDEWKDFMMEVTMPGISFNNHTKH